MYYSNSFYQMLLYCLFCSIRGVEALVPKKNPIHCCTYWLSLHNRFKLEFDIFSTKARWQFALVFTGWPFMNEINLISTNIINKIINRVFDIVFVHIFQFYMIYTAYSRFDNFILIDCIQSLHKNKIT